MPTAIEFNNISKQYRLGLVSTKTLSHDLNRWWQTAVLHKEDPYLKIGSVNDRSKAADSEYVWALKDIDFKVEQGDVVGIIGKNGAGKSTLLKLLSRVTGPTTGTIKAKGRIGSLLEVGTGFHPEMTGRENIYMNGAILGMTKAEITRKLDEIVDFSGCERYIDTPMKRYSSGMMVRLGFAVAAHLDPEILVVDEVLAVGDMAFQKKCLDKMGEVSASEGRTILYVSHNMNTIRQMCSKCVVLNQGKLIYNGEVEEAIQLYMNSSEAAFERELDYSKASHGKWSSRKILFSKAIVEEENNHYSSRDEMNVVFFLESTGDYDRVRFMMILFLQDGTRLAKTESENFSVHQGMNEIHTQIPLAGLADGAYYLEISILQYGNYHAREKADYVPNTLPFYIFNSEAFGIRGEKWNGNLWGHFMMQPIRICEHSNLH